MRIHGRTPGGFPAAFTIRFSRVDRLTYQLITTQGLLLPREKAFSFFEDPRNLFEITPGWLHFVMQNGEKSEAREGAEFDYTIRWYGLTIGWKSRIIDYRPPERFTDIQVIGPYHFWRHLHTFEDVPEGTLMIDTVTYRLPCGFLGKALHRISVKKQLEDIFRYRARRIDEWARGASERKRI